MTTYTQAQLIEAVLDELKVVGAGQTASAEDSAKVQTRIGPVLADLAAREIFYVGDVEAIEEAPFLYLAICVALRCANVFSVSAQELRDLSSLAIDAEDKLQRISAGPAARGTLKVDRALVGWGRIGRGSYSF
jgi:hypothetical protein